MPADHGAPLCSGDPVACLLLKLRVRDQLEAREEEVLRSAISEIETFRGGRTIVRSGDTLSHSALLVEGLVARYKDLREGQRQIMELHVPGDFLDLHGFLLKKLDHDVGAISPSTIAWVPHETLRRISEQEPHLTRLLWLSTLMDAAIQRERILSVGRRPALARIAHLLCELYLRLEMVGLADGMSFPLALTQVDLADATGLTSVHVNRMLRQLRSDGLMTFRNAVVEIHDPAALERVAEFDRSYLFLNSEPR